MKTYINYCKDHAIDALEEMKGNNASSYGCDLAYELCEEINVNGTATFSRAKAREYIREWWDEAGAVYEFQKQTYGEALHNHFEDPEAFHVYLIIGGVSVLLSNCSIVYDAWNDDLELTDDIIDGIIAQINEQGVIEF